MKLKFIFSRLLFASLLSLLFISYADAQRYYKHRHHDDRYYAYGPRYNYLPRASVSISFGGLPYYYGAGAFYKPYGGYYRTIRPPYGIRVGFLPYGYRRFYVGPSLFFYYNGIFYRQYNDREYEVVNPPMGAEVTELPDGAQPVTVNGEKFYEKDGTYYKPQSDKNNHTSYVVVGKNGEVNNTPEPLPAPNIGDRFDKLPDGCKTVSINGQQYFVAPDDTYYKQIIEGKITSYEVVGNSATQGNK